MQPRDLTSAELGSFLGRDLTKSLIIFDIDGTLNHGNWNAKASPELVSMLNRLIIETNHGVAIITGRDYSDLDRFFGGKIDLNSLVLATTFGREITIFGERHEDDYPRFPVEFADRMRAFYQRWEPAVQEAVGDDSLENVFDVQYKGNQSSGFHAFAVHHDNVHPAIRFGIKKAVTEIFQEFQGAHPDAIIIYGGDATEIVRHGAISNKGEALLSFMERARFEGRTNILYAGDTISDEPALRVVKNIKTEVAPDMNGMAIAVGTNIHCREAATHCIDGPQELVNLFSKAVAPKDEPPFALSAWLPKPSDLHPLLEVRG